MIFFVSSFEFYLLNYMILHFLKNHFIYYNRSNSLRPPRPPPSRLTNDEEIKKYIAIFFFHPIAKKTKQTKRMKVKSLTILLSIKVWLWRMERDGQLLSRTTVDMFSGNLPNKFRTLLQMDSNVKVYHLPNYDALFSQDGEKCGSWLWQKRKKV